MAEQNKGEHRGIAGEAVGVRRGPAIEGMRVARAGMPSGGGVALVYPRHSAALGHLRIELPKPVPPARDPIPIWLAALLATHCQATANGEDHAVRWACVSGRALYTNAGSVTEIIQPLGVSLKVGQTVAVSWLPGQSAYTVEVYRAFDHCSRSQLNLFTVTR